MGRLPTKVPHFYFCVLALKSFVAIFRRLLNENLHRAVVIGNLHWTAERIRNFDESHFVVFNSEDFVASNSVPIKLIDDAWRFFTLDAKVRVWEIGDADGMKQMERRTKKFIP